MPENILAKIIQKKNEKIEILKKTISLDSLNELIEKNKLFIDFKEKIENNIKENRKNRNFKKKYFNRIFERINREK